MKRIAFVPLLGLVVACGGGGGDNQPTSQPAPVTNWAGIYSGVVNSTQAGSLTAVAVANTSGEIRYVASNNVMVKSNISGNGGSGILYYGGNSTTINLSNVTLSPVASVSGKYTTASGDLGTFSFIPNAVYNNPKSITSLSGNYYSSPNNTTSGIAVTLTLDSSGTIVGSDATGQFSGHVSQPDTSKNLYAVSIVYANGNTYAGMGFWSYASSGFIDNSFYVQVSGINNAYAMGAVLVKQ